MYNARILRSLTVASLTAAVLSGSVGISSAFAQSLYPARGDSSSILPSTTPPASQAQTPPQQVCPPGMAPNGSGGFSPVVPGLGGPAVIPSLGYEVPIPAAFKMAPKFDPGMWNGNGGGFASKGYLGAGTVLTAIIEQDLSSNKSKVGDIFCLRLEDGFSPDNGVTYVIPKQSKIVGAVTSVTTARSQRGGPGALDISLQTLVFPDGRSCPFYGYVSVNTNQKMTKNSDIAKTTAGYGTRTISSALSMVTGRVGFGMTVPRYGNDFKLEHGEIIPIKCSRMMNLNQMAPSPQLAQAGTGGGGMGSGMAPPLAAPFNQRPIELSAGPAKSLNPDPNEIFNQPLQQATPVNQMPEPF